MTTRPRLGPQALGNRPGVVYGNPVLDPRTPAIPAALSATTMLEIDPSGTYSASVTLTWTAPTTADDGTPLIPIQIEVWSTSDPTMPFAMETVVSSAFTTVTIGGYTPATTWEFEIRSMSSNGVMSVFSAPITVVMPSDTTPPQKPSMPALATGLGAVTITWDGLATGSVAMDPDFDHIIIQRAGDPSFATAITVVGNLTSEGSLSEGTLTVGATLYYRFIATDLAGNKSDPSQVSSTTVTGITGPDIPDNLIDATKLAASVNSDIQSALDGVSGLTTDIAGLGKVTVQPTAPTDATTGALWFDSSNGNEPMVYTGTGFDSVRDAILDAAFTGQTLNGSFLDADTVQAKFIAAGVVDATSIIAQGTITAASGIIGSIDAGTISVGLLSAARIGANTISATKLILGDTQNLTTEPLFDGGGAGWMGSGSTVAISDLPSTGTGYVWDTVGNSTTLAVINTRSVTVTAGDQFYATCLVRKTGSGTTGSVYLGVTVKRNGQSDIWVQMGTFTFATGGANVWTPLAGSCVIPAGGYVAAVTLRVGSNVSSGDIQFANVVLRHKNGAELVVDGSITAASLAVGAITAASIGANTITSYNIAAGTITSSDIASQTITANNIASGSLTSASGVFGSIDASYIQTGTLSADRIQSGSIAGSKLASTSITGDKIATGTITSNNIATGTITASDIQAGSLSSASGVFGSISASSITTGSMSGSLITAGTIHGSKLIANTVSADMLSVSTLSAVSAAMGSITSGTITGATIQTGAAYPRVVMSSNGLFAYNSGGGLNFGLYAADGHATFAGTISSSTVSSSSISGTLTNGGSISGGSLVSPAITGYPYISSGAYLYGRMLSSSGGSRVELNGGTALDFYYGGNRTGEIYAGVGNYMQASGGFMIAGSLWFNASTYSNTAPNLYWASPSSPVYVVNSSLRGKMDIQPIENPRRVFELEPSTWAGPSDIDAGQRFMGFIAEQVAETDLEDILTRDARGWPSGVQYDRITALLQPIVKEHDSDIAALKARVAVLEAA